MNLLTQNEFQLAAEYKRWEILLSTLKNENAFLMHKLSEVLEGNVDKEFITQAEYFLNEFVAKDEYIKEMENDVRGELRIINNVKDKLPAKTVNKYEKLKNEINYLEKNFLALKQEFDKSTTKS